MFVLSLIIHCSFILHPLHVSVTEIEYRREKKTLEIMIRVFADDLEETLRADLQQPSLDILQPQNGMTLDQMASQYLSKKFSLKTDSRTLKTQYLGSEREADAFIFYIEVENVKKFTTIEVRNDIINELYDDQSNIVHVTVQDEVKSLRLTKDTPAEKLTFDIQ